MNKTMILIGCVFVMLTGSAFLPAQETQATTADEEMKAMMEQWAAYAAPGEHHQRLAERVGTWDVTVRFWATPDAPPQVSKGVSRIEAIMGGRYILDHFESDFNGQPFKGMGISGYDNFKKKFSAVWIDSMSTGIMRAESQGDTDGDTIVYIAEMPDPVTGTYKMTRSVETKVDADTFRMEAYDKTPDGKEFRNMEMIYQRRK